MFNRENSAYISSSNLALLHGADGTEGNAPLKFTATPRGGGKGDTHSQYEAAKCK